MCLTAECFFNGDATVKILVNQSGAGRQYIKGIKTMSLEVASDANLDIVINCNPDNYNGNATSQLVGVDVNSSIRNMEDGEFPFLISTSGYVNIEINSKTPEKLTNIYNACVTGYIDLEAHGASYLSMKTVAGNCILSKNHLPQWKLSVVDTVTDMNPFEVADATEHYNFAGTTKDKRFVAVGRNYEGKEIPSKDITEAFGTVRINSPLKESASTDKFDMQIEWGNVSEGAVKQIVLGDSIGATATIKIYPKIGYKLSKELTVGDFYFSTAVKYDMVGNTNENSFLSFSVRFTPTLAQEPAINMPRSLDKKELKCNEDFVITAEYTLPEGVTDENVYIEWMYYNVDDDMEYPLKNLDGLEGASVKGLGTKTITISGYKKGNAISLREIWYMVLVLGHRGIGYYTSVPVEIVHNNTKYTDLGKFHSYECSDCGYSPKQAHKYNESWSYDENGHYHLCVCGSKKDVADHELTKKYNDTQHWDECLCGYTEAKHDHTFGDYIITKQATASEAGLKHKECAICGYKTVSETIPTITDEPTTKPTEPTTKPAEPTTKPAEPTTKPTEPTTKPAEPTTKPAEPTTKPTEPTEKPTDPIADFLLGDVNGDGHVKANDARIALRAAAKLEELDERALKAADLDGNGKVTAAEARRILRFVAKLDKKLK